MMQMRFCVINFKSTGMLFNFLDKFFAAVIQGRIVTKGCEAV